MSFIIWEFSEPLMTKRQTRQTKLGKEADVVSLVPKGKHSGEPDKCPSTTADASALKPFKDPLEFFAAAEDLIDFERQCKKPTSEQPIAITSLETITSPKLAPDHSDAKPSQPLVFKRVPQTGTYVVSDLPNVEDLKPPSKTKS